MKAGKIELLNIDCMEYMATVPDKHFDLAIACSILRGVNSGAYTNANIKRAASW